MDSTTEREEWEREIAAVLHRELGVWLSKGSLAQIVKTAVDEAIDDRTSKAYSFYSLQPDELVTGRQFDGLMGSLTHTSNALHELKAQIDTAWHVKAGRAIAAAWKGWLGPLVLVICFMFIGWCVGEVLQGLLQWPR